MVARTLRSFAWNRWVFDEHFELPQKALSSQLLTYRLRPAFYREPQLLSFPLPRMVTSLATKELKEVTE